MLALLVFGAVALQSQPRIELVWTLELDRANVDFYPITGNDEWTLFLDDGFKRLTVATGDLRTMRLKDLKSSDRAAQPDLVLQRDPDRIQRQFLPDLKVYDVWRPIFDHPFSYEPARGWDTVVRAPLFFRTRPPGWTDDMPSVTFVHDGAVLIAEGEEHVYSFSRSNWLVENEMSKPVNAHTDSRLTSDLFIVFNETSAVDGSELLSSYAITTELEPVETGSLFESFILEGSYLLTSTVEEVGHSSRSGVAVFDLSEPKRLWRRADVAIGPLSSLEVRATVWKDRVVVTESREPFTVSAVLVLDLETGETIATKRLLGKVIAVYPYGEFLVVKAVRNDKIILRGLRLG